MSGTATFRDLDEDEVTKPPSQPNRPLRGAPLPYASAANKLPPHTASSPQPPPDPPRPITPAVRRRSWMEPPVRFWWVATLVQLVIAATFITEQITFYWRDNRLIQYGVAVTATITSAGDEHDTRTSRTFPPDSPCDIQFVWNGQTIQQTGVLLTVVNDTDFIHPGETISLRVDPSDPTTWTDRKVPEPLPRRLVAATIMLPTVLATVLAAYFLNRRVLRAWRYSQAVEYAVVDSTHSALAPLSHAVRCEPILPGMDRRLVTIYLPGRFAKPATGEILWLMRPPGKSQSWIAAAAYE
ncbi:MAG: DUF3592 domain-containing protein [Tepidisphaeraceae bacterium]